MINKNLSSLPIVVKSLLQYKDLELEFFYFTYFTDTCSATN